MFSCKCCGYECDCMDLYYDHIMFDNRHHEMARREAEQLAALGTRRMSSRGSIGSMRKRSSLLSRAKHQLQQATVQIQSTKATFILGAEAY
ncbi:hypothetical protein LPJ66_000992 [Kickxella alabastrina]|uniref:Uncharacterized protein n=1 Tax=Kickxella alabastrina TaxID=61397 RepID=A0ACC1IUK5_9FUNG|nr:hypothetical protein LPJ66_000992 [Kickxella alabastrina]